MTNKSKKASIIGAFAALAAILTGLLLWIFLPPQDLKDGINSDTRLRVRFFEYEKYIFRHDGVDMAFRLLSPDDSADGLFPLVVFLNGKGSEGIDNRKQMNPSFVNNFAKYGQDAFVLVPQCAKGFVWDNYELRDMSVHVEALIDLMLETNPRIDRRRIYLTGISMGGWGVSHLVNKRPDYYAAAHVAAGGNYTDDYALWKDFPAWFAHGAQDDLADPEWATRFVEGVKNAGNDKIKMTLYPDLGHDIGDAFYDDAEVWDWLFSQRRK